MTVEVTANQYLEQAAEQGWPYMRTEIPEIKALVQSNLIERVKVTRYEVERAVQGRVCLDVIAPKLFPHARKTLIDNEVVKEHNVIGTSSGTLDEQKITLSWYAGRLMAFLRIIKGED